MEPIGQATQFAQTAMDMANKVARQQAEDPSAFFPSGITESGRSDPGEVRREPIPHVHHPDGQCRFGFQ